MARETTPKAMITILAYALLTIGVAVSCSLAWYSHKIEKEKSALRIQIETDKLTLLVKQRMSSYEQILLSGAALFDASVDVSRNEWRAFVEKQKVQSRFPGIQGVGYSVVLKPHELDEHIKKMRAEGFTQYKIKPEGKREFYTSIIYIEPFSDRNRRAFGYDMYSEKVRREALQRAIDTGQPALSGKVRLLQENTIDEQAGFLMYIAIYKKGAMIQTTADRMENLQGFVYAPFRAKDLMNGILGSSQNLLSLHIHDGIEKNDANLLYDSSPQLKEDVKYSVNRVLDINGRKWTLCFDIHSGFYAQSYTMLPWIVLIGGIVSSILLFAFVWALERTRKEAVKLADEMTSELQKSQEVLRASEERFRRLIKYLPIPLGFVNDKGAIELINDRYTKVFGYTKEDIPTIEDWWRLAYPDLEYRRWVLRTWSTASKKAQDENHDIEPIEYEVTCKNGNVRTVEISGISVTGGLLATFVDITERKDVQKQLESFNEELAQQVELAVKERLKVEAERQKERTALIQSEKMAQLGNMLGAIIHQWKQPLNLIALEAQNLKDDFKYGELDENAMNGGVEKIMEQVRFMSKTADDFRDFYKPSREIREFSLKAEIEAVAALLGKQLKTSNIELMIEGDEKICVVGHTSEFKQVILNIVSNAKDVFEERKTQNPSIKVVVFANDGRAFVTVTDNAGGIEEQLLPNRLFEQFSSTKGERGTGIGLSLSRTIIEEKMNGRLTAVNVEGGAQFMIELPLPA